MLTASPDPFAAVQTRDLADILDDRCVGRQGGDTLPVPEVVTGARSAEALVRRVEYRVICGV